MDHYKKKALEANALHGQEYQTKYLEASTKLIQQQEMIVTLNHEGVEQLQDKEVEHLKEGMRYIRQVNKELNDKYQQISIAYEDMMLKEPNKGEHQLLKSMLKKVHEKCVKAEEAYKQAMDLYLQDTQAPVAIPSLGLNDLE